MNDNKGFSLIELIIVVAIIAVIGAGSITAYLSYIRTSRESVDETSINSFVNSLESALNSPNFSKDAKKLLECSKTSKVRLTYEQTEDNIIKYKKYYIYSSEQASSRAMTNAEIEEFIEKVNSYIKADVGDVKIKSNDNWGRILYLTISTNQKNTHISITYQWGSEGN